ncbi:agamous-like MADS-box protein AGL61 [Magnolia sinica]|uniref:agamous-like MADS-box protein AGL61 n=1 Tax=Magnolia sinica TaxID=86752 RepID=UPI002657BF4A|nr:agamous-like MADS-box protein AGL61 [Magnolia sinica]
MGKRKFPMAKIEKKSSLLVSFSKRRQGLFKKAFDLCSLTGSHIAILAFSPAGNPFTFGHPSFDSVIDRYVEQCSGSNGHFPSPSSSSALGSSHSIAYLDGLNQRLFDIQRQLDENVEKNRRLKEGNPKWGWWDLDVEDLDVGQLETFLSELQKFREVVASRVVETVSKEVLEKKKVARDMKASEGLEEEEVGFSNMVSRDMKASEGLEKEEVGFSNMVSRDMKASEGLEEEEEVWFWDMVSRDMKASSSKKDLEEEVGFWGKQCLKEEAGFWDKQGLEEKAGFGSSKNSIWIGDEEFLF